MGRGGVPPSQSVWRRTVSNAANQDGLKVALSLAEVQTGFFLTLAFEFPLLKAFTSEHL